MTESEKQKWAVAVFLEKMEGAGIKVSRVTPRDKGVEMHEGEPGYTGTVESGLIWSSLGRAHVDMRKAGFVTSDRDMPHEMVTKLLGKIESQQKLEAGLRERLQAAEEGEQSLRGKVGDMIRAVSFEHPGFADLLAGILVKKAEGN